MSDTANPNPKGLTTDFTDAATRPVNAQHSVPPVSPLNRVEVHDQELVEVEGLDPDSLDPERVYRLVPFKNHPLVRRRMRQGYVTEHLRQGGPRPLVNEESPDGTIRIGDRQLMSCPRSLWVERRAKNFRFSETRLQNVESQQKVRQKVADLQAQGARVELIDYSKTSGETVEEREKTE